MLTSNGLPNVNLNSICSGFPHESGMMLSGFEEPIDFITRRACSDPYGNLRYTHPEIF